MQTSHEEHLAMTDGRLLILDDDVMTGQTMQSIAEFAGLEVRSTTAHEDFFSAVQGWRPDVIALDLVMPGMDGVEVMKALAERRCRARIIITSGVGSRVLEAAARSAAEHGLDVAGVLAKPFLPAALREQLTRALNVDRTAVPAPPGAPVRRESGTIDEYDLDRAIGHDEVFMVYQPKLHCRSGALAGFEALARWHHPELGVVPPDRFVALAEHTGRMDALTRKVFAQALDWFADLHNGVGAGETRPLSSQTLANLTLSVNVSAVSLDNVELFDWLEERCRTCGVTPDRLILELTETSAMDDSVASLDMMTRLRMKGFQLSIDDFGTGFSSMLQLVRLPFSEIKVDKSFVQTSAVSEESRAVVRSVVDLGRSLGLQTTAEGVEDADTLDYLRRIGCDLAQGFFIAPPMSGIEVLPWARNHDASRESLRLEALRSLEVLDTVEEARFDRLTRLAQRLYRVPIALVSLVDEDRQWFKSHPGLDMRETPRKASFCTYAIQDEDTTVVPDARLDPRFRDNPLVAGAPEARFYAGCPLRTADGSTVGTLCVMDTVPRFFTREDRDLLGAIARLVEKELRDHRTAISDPLTGVLTRQGFEGRAGDTLQLAWLLQQSCTLLFFDVDRLHEINRRFSHAEGDCALLAFSRMLKQTFRESDLIARLGGDEFVVLMFDAEHEQAERAAVRLREALGAHSARSQADYALSVTVGIASAGPGQQKDLQALLAEADSRMYEAKRH
jgi:diguanylate cyclase (GGDEF)-like protein